MSAQLELFDWPREAPCGDLDARCLDCGIDTIGNGNYYMLHDDVWKQANPAVDGMLCIRCVERRLRRPLTPDDFSDMPVNRFGPCARLRGLA